MGKSWISRACGFIILLLILSGCDFAPQDVSSPHAGVSGSVLFSDDFSDNHSGWGTWDKDGALVEYQKGGLRILVHDTQYDFWSVAGKSFEDVTIEVDAVRLAGSEDNDFGLICRYMDKDNYYMLVISSDGYYGAAKLKNGKYSLIGSDKLQYSSAIAHGDGLNHLRADCVGSSLRLYANGHKLADVEDTDFVSGDVGLIAGSYQLSGVDILFDNFVVKKP